jgi:hypothetical protein
MLLHKDEVMGSFGELLQRRLVIFLVVLLALPIEIPAVAQQSAPAPQGGTSSSSQSVPQAPAAQPSPSTSQPANVNQQTGGQQPGQTPPQNGNTAPVGTAVAPYEKGVGVAASRPAGVVIAPAKQRRTRSFLIKVGLVVGAAVAVGTVVGLSKATPSAPAH